MQQRIKELILSEYRENGIFLSKQAFEHKYHICHKTLAKYSYYDIVNAVKEELEHGHNDIGFTVEQAPKLLTVDDIKAHKMNVYNDRRAMHDHNYLTPIQMQSNKPFVLFHFGDPHIDDDGCNFPQLQAHIDLINANRDIVLCANVGDSTNNWVGRLARLYADQSTTAEQAWRLTEWFVGAVPWIYIVGGNHDLWSGAGDPLKWIIGKTTMYRASQVRVSLDFPNGRKCTINARHDFNGFSQWNPAHGAGKAAQMGWRDNILVCGHKHTSCYIGPFKDPMAGTLSHCIQVATYKDIDNFAVTKGFKDNNVSPCACTVINPLSVDELGFVQLFWCPYTAIDFCKWLRSK